MGESSSSPSNTDPKGGDLVKDEVRESDADRIETQANTNAASRAIAVMILMLLPGIAGSYLDKWLGTQFFVVTGFIAGIGIAIFGLLYVARIADLAAKKSLEMRRGTKSRSQELTERRKAD